MSLVTIRCPHCAFTLKVSCDNTVIGEWRITERTGGSETFTLEIPK